MILKTQKNLQLHADAGLAEKVISGGDAKIPRL
jgi:hypothetical protein